MLDYSKESPYSSTSNQHFFNDLYKISYEFQTHNSCLSFNLSYFLYLSFIYMQSSLIDSSPHTTSFCLYCLLPYIIQPFQLNIRNSVPKPPHLTHFSLHGLQRIMLVTQETLTRKFTSQVTRHTSITVPFPENSLSHPRLNLKAHLLKLLNTCRPCKLISPQTLSEAQIKLETHSFNSAPQFRYKNHELCFIQTDVVLRVRWKVLVLCTASVDQYDSTMFGRQDRFTHESYKQIEKDVKRTYPNIAMAANDTFVQRFLKTLKNIAIYFPKIGYTQGMNFLVGFLLLCRYEADEVFWIVVHLALNQRFMILGLFDDNFPLAELYYDIFCSLLTEKFGKKLANKIQQIPKEMWVLQWFMSFYLYSFPIDFAKFAFDLMLVTSGLGLVYFALGIINELRSEFQKMSEDQAEYVELFQRMKDRKWIEQNLDVKRIIEFGLSIHNQTMPNKIASIINTKWKNHSLMLIDSNNTNRAIQGAPFAIDPYTELFMHYDDPYYVRSLMERYVQQLSNLRKEQCRFGSSSVTEKSIRESQLRKITNPVWHHMKIKKTLKSQYLSQQKSYSSRDLQARTPGRLVNSMSVSKASHASMVFIDRIKYSLIQGRVIGEEEQSFEGQLDDRVGCNEYFKAVGNLRVSVSRVRN